MKQKTRFEVFDGVEVPVSPLLKRQRSKKYGSVADLDDEDLIEPTEVERIYLKTEFAPILALPVKTRSGWIKRGIDEDGTIEVGAFGTVDFDRHVQFDKALYKADKLKEELSHEKLMVEQLSSHIKTMAKYEIVKNVLRGILDVDDIVDDEMYRLARRCLRMRRLQREINELQQRSKERRLKKAKKFWESLE
jgi:hypothetical protein